METREDRLDLFEMNLTQVNGQRRYGGPPPGWIGPPPPRGCEIFLKIPRDCFEDTLLPLLEKIGKVYEVRMMMDFSGSNRGYCFVTFANSAAARKAVEILDNLALKPDRKVLGARLSYDNHKLFIGRIPCDKTKEEIYNEMCRVTEEVKEITVYKKINDKTQNRSYAFVEYQSHKAAAIARRTLFSARLWGSNIIVDWAEPENEVPEDKLAEVKCLFVRNFSSLTTQNFLLEEISRATNNPDGIKSVKIVRDFAFVDFYTRDDALKAAAVMNGRIVDGFQLEVQLAKPRTNRHTQGIRTNRRQMQQMTRPVYCLDLLEQVQFNSMRRGPFELQCREYLRPELMHDARHVVGHWKRKFPDLSFISFLSDICVTEGWGQPDYFLKEIKQKLRHRKIKMFAYKLIIRGLAVHQTEFVFDPVDFVDDKKLAKEYSAIYALSRIRLSSIQGKPNRPLQNFQITPEDVANFFAFFKTIPSFHPALTGIMAGIDRELAEAYYLLSLSEGTQTVHSISYQPPNASSEIFHVGLPCPQEIPPPIYNSCDNSAISQVGQMPMRSYPNLPASVDLTTAGNQMGIVGTNFPVSVCDCCSCISSSTRSVECTSVLSSFSENSSAQSS